jgi:hypothetical protein
MSYPWDSFAVGAVAERCHLHKSASAACGHGRGCPCRDLDGTAGSFACEVRGGDGRAFSAGLAGSLYDVFSGGCVSYSFNPPESGAP